MDATEDKLIGLEDGVGVLALRGGDPMQFRIYSTYEDCQHHTGISRIGNRWHFLIDGVDRGPIPWPIEECSNGC